MSVATGQDRNHEGETDRGTDDPEDQLAVPIGLPADIDIGLPVPGSPDHDAEEDRGANPVIPSRKLFFHGTQYSAEGRAR